MRRLLATAASGAVLLLGAGCSTDPDAAAPVVPPAGASASAGVSAAAPGGASSGASAGAQPAGDAALSSNTEAICTSASKAGGAAAVTFAADLKLLVDASSSQDPDAAAKARQKVERDVDQWSFALADLSNLVSDKAVKKALGDLSKEVGALKGDIQKIDSGKVAALQEKLDKAGGKA